MRTCRGFARSSGFGGVAGLAGAIVWAVLVCFGDGAAAAPKQSQLKQVPSKQAPLKQAPLKQAKQAAPKQAQKSGPAGLKSQKQEPVKKETKQQATKQDAKKHEAKKQDAKQESPKQESSKQDPLKSSGNQLEPLKWNELTGWAADDHLAAFAAYQAGCRAARRKPRSDERGLIFGALSNVCRKALALEPQDSAAARAFFEQNFQPVRIARLGEGEGLVTGYYEPIVAGSRFPTPEFSVPIYRRPRDLVADGYKQGSTAFPNKGGRIGRRTENNEIVPYHDRGAIEAGALDGQKLEICWIKDPLDLVAIQIEGSARVILEDGTPLRISYDSHNGYSYSSIERVLAERNLIPRKELTKERIRAWTAAHPEEAAKARATNRAYMFFRVTGLTNDGEPVGAQGVPLTPGRSIAVDRVHEYGTPFFIEGNLPIEDAKPAVPVGRLTIAQDTGSAIVGPARADLYLGAGDEAGRIAGRIKHRGRFSMLVPREVDLAAAASELPLPVPKPKIAESEGDKPDDKGKESKGKEIAQRDDKGKDDRGKDDNGKAEPIRSGTLADGRHVPSPMPPAPMPKTVPSTMPSPMSKMKIVALDTEKAERRGRAESAGARPSADTRHPPQPAPKTLSAPKTKIIVSEIGKSDRKGKADSDNAAWTVAGKQKSLSPAAKIKIVETEGRKQDGRGKAEATKSGATVKPMPPSGSKTKIVETEGRKETGKHEGKGRAESARESAKESTKAGATTAARHTASPKAKMSETEIKKQNGKKAESANAPDGKAAAKPGRQAASGRKSERSLN
jgi:membrane-bound lytic murein transglycosylase A